MSDPDYKKHAKDLIQTVSELQAQILEKHTTAILEEMHDQLRLARSGNDKLKAELDQCLTVHAKVSNELSAAEDLIRELEKGT